MRWLYEAMGRRIARRAKRRYGTTKAYHHLLFRLGRPKKPKAPIVIFQMGKVGSTSIAHGLRLLIDDRPIYHIHYLTWPLLTAFEKLHRKNYTPVRSLEPRHHWESQYLRSLIDKGISGEPWKIITVVREPVGRNLSSFFQNLCFSPQPGGTRYRVTSPIYGIDAIIEESDASPLSELFLRRFEHHVPLVFYDREFKGGLGIDLLAKPFPHHRGYVIERFEHFEVLVLRLEELARWAEPALQEFLGISTFPMAKKNISEEKPYGKIYRAFLETVRLPRSYLDVMYGSRYARHFYLPEEIESFRHRHITRTVPQAMGWDDGRAIELLASAGATCAI